jgi:hypothetical protein
MTERKKLGDISMFELDKIVQKFSGDIFNSDFRTLALRFLSEACETNFFSESFDKIKSQFFLEMGEEDKSMTEEKFYAYVVNLFYGYDKEPGKVLLRSFQKATNELKEIDDRVQHIEGEIDTIKKSLINNDIQIKIPVLRHFLELNLTAKNDVLRYLKEEITNDSLSRSSSAYSQLFPFAGHSYNYAWNPKAYVVKFPTLITNKFLPLSIKKLREVRELFKNDRPSFKKFLSNYIAEEEIVFSIRHNITENHILQERADIINQALDAFESGNRILFASICVLIIEGILHDICILFGINENDLVGVGFQAKINHLRERLGLTLHYEYYSFQFRLLRNKIAHGLMNGSESEEVADLLLLDLEDIIQITNSEKIPLMQKRFFYHQALKDKYPDCMKYIAGYFLLSETVIPKFYNIKENLLIDKIKVEDFWINIEGMIKNDGESRALAHSLLKEIKKLNINELNSKCIKNLKTIPSSTLVKIDKQKILDSILN